MDRRHFALALVASMAALASAANARAAGDPRIALLEAIRANDAATVRRLVAAGVDVDIREKKAGPALVMAAHEGSFDALQALLAARRIDLEARNAKGETALMLAAARGHLPAVQRLIARGAQVNQTGWTALHYAASGGHVDIIRVLLEEAAYIDAESPNGTTPLIMATRQKMYSAMELLVAEGADPTLRNEAGFRAIDYLKGYGETARMHWLAQRMQAFEQRNRPGRPAGAGG